MIFLIAGLIWPHSSPAQEIPKELYDAKYLRSILQVPPFDILIPAKKVERFGRFKEIYCITGRYKDTTKGGHNVFVGLLSPYQKGFSRRGVFNFPHEEITDLVYSAGSLGIYFHQGPVEHYDNGSPSPPELNYDDAVTIEWGRGGFYVYRPELEPDITWFTEG